MENLVASRNKETADKTIKTLDGKLSEAIMYAMTNGPDLEKKVRYQVAKWRYKRTINLFNLLDKIFVKIGQ